MVSSSQYYIFLASYLYKFLLFQGPTEADTASNINMANNEYASWGHIHEWIECSDILLQPWLLILIWCSSNSTSYQLYNTHCYAVEECLLSHSPSIRYDHTWDQIFLITLHIYVTSFQCHSISNHQQIDYFLISLFWLITKKHRSPELLSLCERNKLVTGGFHPQCASKAESDSISWSHHETCFWEWASPYFTKGVRAH